MPELPAAHTTKIALPEQVERLVSLCDELHRTLRGHNGTVGLVTEVSLLHQETRRMCSALESHLREHEEDRRRHQSLRQRVSERVLVWIAVSVLYLATVGAAVLIMNHINGSVISSAASPDMPPAANPKEELSQSER